MKTKVRYEKCEIFTTMSNFICPLCQVAVTPGRIVAHEVLLG